MSSQKRQSTDSVQKMTSKKPRLTYEKLNVTTRGATRRSLSDAVFLTTELLENVLRNLPMKDLLLAQRVCQKWKAVIGESTTLQQALYFMPSAPRLRWKYEHPPVRKVSRVPTDTPLNQNRPRTAPFVLEIATFNPLLCRPWRPVETLAQLANEAWDILKFKKLPSMKYPEASWRKMLMTQPPITDAILACFFEGDDQICDFALEFDLSNPSGITMWDVTSGSPKSDRWGRQVSWKMSRLCIDGMILVSDHEWTMSNEDLKAMAHEPSPWFEENLLKDE